MPFKVLHEIPDENIDNALCAALDPGYGGSYYWCSAQRDPENAARLEAQYLHEVPLKGGAIIITDNEWEDGDPNIDKNVHVLDRASIQRGLDAMSKDVYGCKVIAAIVRDDTDANDGDALIQFSLFGKLIYV